MSDCQDRRRSGVGVTLSIGDSVEAGGSLKLLDVRDGQAAFKSDGGVRLLAWPGDALRLGETTIIVTRVQPSRVTIRVESRGVVRRV